MIREDLTVVDHTLVAEDTYQLILCGRMVHDIKQPGQFVHIRTSTDEYLRRPVSISDYNIDEETITLLYKVIGKGTKALTAYQIGDSLDVLGPGGRGFPVKARPGESVLLTGGGIGVPPLYRLARELYEKGADLTIILGFQSIRHAFLKSEFQQYGSVHIMTDDGTSGNKGFVTDGIAGMSGSFDRYYTCGPTPMLKAVVKQLGDTEGYISMEERMGCGIGACFACVVPSHDEKGYKRICCDGPVFHHKEVVLT
ncbi:dihydroorotate dehydrogenase electron transfer subunit [Halobacillus sp. Cin3]|uniref:dihydroorotate dehydrogenase electron transfer subunit n=1 Tax=Halobacillus sp. Cin3 TaxID=2928441 RepID=UPI00248DE289|nr:dihydroorotate dehydrogenase electron transfer subunit [Halobacillus sp. Cin3]